MGATGQRTGPSMTCSMLTPRFVSGVKMRESQSRGAPAISGPMPRRSASCWKIVRSERASPTGSITRFTPPMMLCPHDTSMSSSSRKVVVGRNTWA